MDGTEKEAALEIKVASYNIHKAIGSDRRRSPERILAVLAEIDADIVVLQEADRRFGTRQSVLPLTLLVSHSPYHPVAFKPHAGSLGWRGNAVLVRRATTIGDATTLALPSLEPRGSVAVELDLHGRRLRVVGMHLDLTGLRRPEQARMIVAHIAARPALPTVIMGDTNEWRRDGGCLEVFHTKFISALTGPSFPAVRPIMRFDRVLVDASFEIIAAGTHRSQLARHASDHLPVWARLAYREPA